MSEPVLEVRDLTVSYGAARVIERLDLEVSAGEVVGLVGPNGAGKTTALRAISGLVPRKAGVILAQGKHLASDPVRVARSGIAHVPEGRGLIPSLTVVQNLRLAVIATRRRYTDADTLYATAAFPALNTLLFRRAGLLSGGEQQMAAIARGLVVRPKLLMIDELSLGLSPKIVHDLLGVLVGVSREAAIGLLLVDQNVRALSSVCDRVYVLLDGRGRLAAHNDEDLMRAVYFGGGTPFKG